MISHIDLAMALGTMAACTSGRHRSLAILAQCSKGQHCSLTSCLYPYQEGCNMRSQIPEYMIIGRIYKECTWKEHTISILTIWCIGGSFIITHSLQSMSQLLSILTHLPTSLRLLSNFFINSDSNVLGAHIILLSLIQLLAIVSTISQHQSQ